MTDVWCSRCRDRGCPRCWDTPRDHPADVEFLPPSQPKTVEQINRDLRRKLTEYGEAQS